MSEARWKLETLIDFETEAAQAPRPSQEISEKIRSLTGDPLMRKRQGFLLWTLANARQAWGKKFLASLALLTLVFALVSFFTASASAWGCYTKEQNGIHVVFFLAITLLLPWAIFLLGLLVMVFRRHITPLSLVASFMLKRINRSLQLPDSVSRTILDHGQILGWRVSRQLQWVAVAYHLGAALSLLILASFREIHFYWESTTQTAMQHLLENAVHILSSPWSAIFPQAVPDIAASRWSPVTGLSQANHSAWWPFLLLCLLIWGIAPRVLLMLFSARKESKLLDQLSFQAPHHRKLWRELDGVKRDEVSSMPIDSAIVIDVGGICADPSLLRPYLLQQLRVNPVAWHNTEVLDLDQRNAAEEAMRMAQAGIVLLVEASALAPRQMQSLLKNIRAMHAEKRVMIVCLGAAASTEQAQQWSDFVDARNDPHLELFFHHS